MSEPPDRNRTDLLWLAIDLDGTLAASNWPASTLPGDPIWPNIAKLREATRAGWKIVIHTARPWGDYEIIEWWLDIHSIEFDRIVCGKLLAACYIDDRNIDIDAESWMPS
jgi:hypothetical protein